jgi:hypothetical protein
MAGLASAFLSANFIDEYGEYADDFSLVQSDGTAHWSIPLLGIVSFFGLVFSVITTLKYNKEKNDKKKLLSKIYFYLGLLGIIIAIIILLNSGVNYIYYLGEWAKWYDSLPSDGRRAYEQMRMVQTALDMVKN